MLETLERTPEEARAPIVAPPEPVRPSVTATPSPPPEPVRPSVIVTPSPPPEPVRPSVTATPSPPPEPVRPTEPAAPPPEPAVEIEIEVEPAPSAEPEPAVEVGPAAEPAFEPGTALEEVEPEPEAPQSPDTGEQRARSLLERGLREPAVELLRTLVETYPDAHGCRRMLAMTLARSGSFEPDVERHFIIALEAKPEDVELRHRLATYYRRANMAARAMLQLRRILSDDPGHAGAWRDLGELEAGEGRRGR
jgi:hypothetical protein